MKKLFCFLFIFLIAASCYGANTNTYVSENTVSFNSVAKIVTFNSAICSISVINDSASGENLFLTLDGNVIGWNVEKTVYTLPVATGSPSSVRLKPGQSISVDLSTRKIGYISGSGGGTGTMSYVAVSDKEIAK